MKEARRFGRLVAMMIAVIVTAVLVAILFVGCGSGGKSGTGPYRLKVIVNPANSGGVSISPSLDRYEEGMDVEVTATPEKGYAFDAWSGDDASTSKSMTMRMSGKKKKKELTANFKVYIVPSVIIGTQMWMMENVSIETADSKCYNNDISNCKKYGRLYNWNDAQIVCTDGWHLPSEEEWKVLTDYIGGIETAAKKLKSKTGWNNDGNGTDEYGFSALPGGDGTSNGYFNGNGAYGSWWSATERDTVYAWNRRLYYNNENVYKYEDEKTNLFSVRCLED